MTISRIFFLLVSATAIVGCGGPAVTTADEKGPAAKTWTREEFRQLVVGKSADEVISAVGRPDKTSDNGGDPYWYYWDKTVDPTSGKTDSNAQVVFKHGQVARVNY
jgi:outer membrane protein assembly factor BamE (lipoprotein component of BamABCDE complex)